MQALDWRQHNERPCTAWLDRRSTSQRGRLSYMPELHHYGGQRVYQEKHDRPVIDARGALSLTWY